MLPVPMCQVLREYLPRLPLTRYLLPAFAKGLDRETSGAAAALPSSSGNQTMSKDGSQESDSFDIINFYSNLDPNFFLG